MARSKAGTFEQFKINGIEVKVGDVLAYSLGKKTRSFGTYVGTPGPANITVIDANGRNEGKPMYVNQWKVLGFYAPPAADEQVTPVADEQAAQESTGGGEMIKYHRFLAEAPVEDVVEDVPVDESMIDAEIAA